MFYNIVLVPVSGSRQNST